jgi:hypothetical protein
MKYAVEMGSDAIIYIRSLVNIGYGLQKLMEGIYIQTPRQKVDLISLLLVFQTKGSRVKMCDNKSFSVVSMQNVGNIIFS